jgi:cation:H+ antiporter
VNYLILVLGFAALVAGAKLLVSGAANIATKFRVSEMAIGLTIVAFGTSLPELFVSLTANFGGYADLAIANVLGSNVSNVLLILGIAAIIRTLPVTDATVLTEIPFSLTAALLVGFLANAALFSTSSDLIISRTDGAILLFFLALFMVYVYKLIKDSGKSTDSRITHTFATSRSLLFIGIGMLGLYVGGKWVVDSSIIIATDLGVSERMIGLTVVAIGTSLPELFASAVAAHRGNTDLAVGNVVGSNVFNLLWILGATAFITEIPFELINNNDIAMVVLSTALVIVAIAVGRKGTIERWHGIVFLVAYAAYLIFVINRDLYI